jgi:catechol 2,3-dioxygenase-like lactoylglutathione lyase family enzyme
MASVQVRYIVYDVDSAMRFYCGLLGFREEMHPAESFAILSRGDLRLILSVPSSSASDGHPMSDGLQQQPGGWNRFSIEVSDLDQVVRTLSEAGAQFRSDRVTGVGGTQIVVEDPSGNPVELFEPLRPEARLGSWRSGSG